ncbi:ankyrin repeat and KH domain-containing protein 1 isoform X2 [Tetranychus urticae]|uniref:ankyrin repeat and KH domain-containing protein 1 isoform X2 n=1 Tax=Tetranychus urticae TaxID=32264 RepID=UPI00077BC468|nr:ankyrin repeat and KH domain-containing protein 1 isoform X2 [Tetranychus urticae]
MVESSESARKRPHEAVAAAVVDGSCLIDACNVGDLEAVRKLLDEGRNVNEITEEGESLLSLACSSGYAELAQLLLATRANVEDRGLKDTTPLMEASSAGHVDIVKLLISHGANVNAQTSQGNTPLMYACAGGHVDVVKVLIEAGANVEDHNENGHTPLMEAASAGHVAVAKILVEKGASINSHSDEFKESALTLACYKGHLEMVRFLLEAGADQEHKTEEMHTALMEASMDGHVEVARLLLDSGAQVNMPADSFESPLTLASCGGHVELAMLLLERGANIEEVNDEGYTPLMEAAREGQEEMVALLLSQGADINAQTEETQETALTLACCSNSLEVADFLIKAGADIEAGGNTPLMEAAQEGHIELVKHLINVGANVNATNANGETALMHACENGHTDVAEILLYASADLEHEADGGRTPLMKTTRAGHICTVQFLVSRGANVNKITPTNDATPLSLACAGGHLPVVEYLLSQGADPTHRLKDNATMLMEAAKGGHTKVVQLLLDYPNAICRSPPPEDASSTSAPNLNNITSPELCDNSTTTTVTTTTTTTTSRMVQRGSIISTQDTSDNQVTSSTSSQRKSSSISNASGKYGLPKTSRNKSLSFNKPSESVEPYIPLPKGRNSSASGKHLERSLSDSSASQLLNSVNLLSNSTDNSSSCSSGTDAFKDAETLSQCISVKLGSNDDLSPTSREQQILHKQQILEELVRVEKELQEKRQEHLLLNQQAEQQQQLIQTLCYEADLSASRNQGFATIPASTNTSLVSDDGHNHLLQTLSADQQSYSLNNLTTNLSSQAMLLLDMSALKQQLEAGDPLNFQLPSSLTASGTIPNSQPILLQTSFGESNMTNSAINSSNSNIINISNDSSNISSASSTVTTTDTNFLLNGLNKTLSDISASSVVPQIMTSSSFSPSTISPSTSIPGSNRSRTRQTIKVKNAFSKAHHHQHQHQHQPIIPSFDALNHRTSPSGSGTLFSSSVGPLIESFNFSSIPVSAGSFSQSSILPSPGTIATSMALPVITSTNSIIAAQAESMTQTPSIDLLIESETQTPTDAPLPSTISISTSTSSLTLSNAKLNPASSPPPWYPPIDLDSQTDSNHDTALTLACAGGHEELVELLIKRGANIEHRDKKGFTPLMLAATAGHAGVCELLLSHSADIESQSERTKDTALSLACSSGRYEVVELLLEKGSNKEHRNVSDYTPLSLAASGGYVNIIKLLLSHGAEINSRTGSKLGISPLMLAAMNGHTGTVKLLLDMGSDINAQIETNRNTALTLACFQGRKEVVDLLLDRKANVEHRAKTGLTPLMEAASGGYVEVGRILLDKGADVNAPPVPSSRDTALTISADKGHYRFVELLLQRGAQVDVKNKKGSSPLWLACNGGHLDVVQLLVNAKADIDSQDNRKVSCLMAAFRKGHVKVVKWMVKHVTQFPSDQEMTRYIAMINDDELLKKCHQCMEHIRAAKEKQAAEANKNANILLEQIDMERYREETRRLAAARRREKKRDKKKEKQEREKAAKAAQESKDPANKQKQGGKQNKKNEEKVEVEESDSDLDDDSDSAEEENIFEDITVVKNNQVNENPVKEIKQRSEEPQPPVKTQAGPVEPAREVKPISTPTKKKEAEKNKKNSSQKENNALSSQKQSTEKKDSQSKDIKKPKASLDRSPISNKGKSKNQENLNVPIDRENSPNHENQTKTMAHSGLNEKKNAEKTNASETNRKNINDNLLSELNIEVPKDVTSEKNIHSQKSPCATVSTKSTSSSVSNVSVGNSGASSISNQNIGLKKGQKREEGWKEVVRRSKKVSVPANAISRVIGRGGCNINAVREISGAHIEVEKQKGQGDRQIIIKGSADATRHAQQLINGLVNETDKDLSQIVSQLGLNRSASSNEEDISFSRSGPIKSFSSTSVISSQANRPTTAVSVPNTLVSSYSSGVTKSSSVSAVFTTVSHATLSTGGPARASSGVVSVRASAPINNSAPPFGGSVSTVSSINAWTSPKSSIPPRMQSNSSSQFINSTVTTSSLTFSTSSPPALSSGSKTTISYTTAVSSSKPKTVVKPSTQSVNNLSSTKFITGPESKPSTGAPFAAPVRPLTQPFNSASRVIGPTASNKNVTSKQPFGTNTGNNNNNSTSGGNNVSNSGCVSGISSNSNSSNTNSSSVTTTTTTIPPTSLPTPKTSSSSNVPGSPKSSIPNSTPEYTPFNNLFSKVAQASVWGPSKEAHKPNFASVAATGISSVATSQSAPPMTITSSNNEHEHISVDISKAPGYRGNLHSSPGNASITSTPSSSAGPNFGPIGSGPRNAPCTPPLSTIPGIVSSSAPVRSPISSGTSIVSAAPSSTSPSSPPPSVSPQPSASSSQPRTMMKESASSVDLSPAVVSSYSSNTNTSNISSGYQSSVSSNVYTSSSLANHPTSKQSNFNLTPGSNASRGYSTTTTFSQHHGPLSSVDPIHPAVASGLSDPHSVHACVSSMNPSMPNLINTTVQSSLNPNAPDFSIRSNPNYIPNLSHQQNGPLLRSAAHQHHLQASQPRTMGYQDLMPNVQGIQLQNPQQHAPPLHMQMRAAILAAGASLQMQTLQAQAAQAAQAAQSAQAAQVAQVAQVAQNHVRYQVGPANVPTPGLHPQLQNQSALGGEFNPPSAETLRLLQTALTAFPAANAVLHQSPPQNMQPYNMMQPPISMRQAQQQQGQQASQQTHQQHHHPGQQPNSQRTQAGGSKEADMSDMSEERKLPRPIGTERAQKKNPIHGMSSSNMGYSPGIENLQPNLWPFPNSVEMPSAEGNEWLLPGAGAAPNDELMASMMPINYMMNHNYVSMNETVPEQHEPDYTVGYPYFPSDI